MTVFISAVFEDAFELHVTYSVECRVDWSSSRRRKIFPTRLELKNKL
jgi:hypothetical protein